MKRLSVFDRHQIKIAKRTLKLSNLGARILGGMTKEEARKILRKHGIALRKTYPRRPKAHRLPGHIAVQLSRPIRGYWDGIPRSYFRYEIEVIDGGYWTRADLPYHFKVTSLALNSSFLIPPCAQPFSSAARRLKNSYSVIDDEVVVTVEKEARNV